MTGVSRVILVRTVRLTMLWIAPDVQLVTAPITMEALELQIAFNVRNFSPSDSNFS